MDVCKDHWVLWRTVKALYEAELGRLDRRVDSGVSVLHVDKALYLVCRDFYRRYREKLLSGDFIMYHYGPYYDKLEDLLCECERLGLIEYIVEVYLPEAPSPDIVDIDYAVQIAESQIKEIVKTYYEKRVKPLRDNVEVPPDLDEVLHRAGCSRRDLEALIEEKARVVAGSRAEHLLKIIEPDITGKKIGEIVL